MSAQQFPHIPDPGVAANWQAQDLQRQINELRDKAEQDRKTPWYQQPSARTGLLAFAVAVVSLSYTVFHQQNEELKQKLNTLRSNLIQISEIRDQYNEAYAAADKNLAAFQMKSASLNTKKQLLIEQANAIIEEVGGSHVSPAVLTTLASETIADANFPEAKRYYQLGIDTATSDYSKRWLKAGLAWLYMMPKTSVTNVPEGRRLYNEAVASLQYLADDNSIENRGYILGQWAYGEMMNGNATDAKKLSDQARDEYMKMDIRNPRRKYALDTLAQSTSAYTSSNGASPTPASSPPQ